MQCFCLTVNEPIRQNHVLIDGYDKRDTLRHFGQFEFFDSFDILNNWLEIKQLENVLRVVDNKFRYFV